MESNSHDNFMILASLRYHGNLCESHNLLVWDEQQAGRRVKQEAAGGQSEQGERQRATGEVTSEASGSSRAAHRTGRAKRARCREQQAWWRVESKDGKVRGYYGDFGVWYALVLNAAMQ